MDLLLDVNVAVDLCTGREPYVRDADLAVAKCIKEGGRIWLYVGSVQTLEYVTRDELKRKNLDQALKITKKQLKHRTRNALVHFAKGKHWLAALAGEGDVFSSDDPEDEQLIKALDRFEAGTIKLLTREQALLRENPDKTLSPEQYCQLTTQHCPISFIDLKAQQDSIRPKLEQRIHKVLNHGQYIMGPEVKELEARLAEYVGVKHAITCANGTDALSLALMTLGIGRGDAVFCPTFTFFASAEVIALAGATPVFVDSDRSTFNICPKDLEKQVQRTLTEDKLNLKAIIAVDLFGLPANYPELDKIAEKYGLKIVEDAAQGFGGEINGKKVCSFGDISTTSFFPAKPLGCFGDGGALFTNNDEYADLIKSYRVHGKGRNKYNNIRIGLNSRLDTLQASILLQKLEVFPSELTIKRQLAQHYSDELREVFSIPKLPKGYESSWAQYTLTAPNRDQLLGELKNQGIPSAVYYGTCMHQQAAFKDSITSDLDFPVASTLSKEVFSIPMNPYLKGSDRIRIVDTLNHNN
jgi:dTDP-4-amino-4,6-dideoxygalactose transaminase